MAEWAKARDSKSCIPKGIGGSNPSLSVSASGGIDYSDNTLITVMDGVWLADGYMQFATGQKIRSIFSEIASSLRSSQ